MNLKGIFNHKPELFKLFLLLIFLFLGLVASSLIIHILDLEIFGKSNINDQKTAQFITSVFLFLIPPTMLYYFTTGSVFRSMGFNRLINRQMILLVFAIFILIQPFITYTSQINADLLDYLDNYFPETINKMLFLEQEAEEITLLFLSMNSIKDLVINLFLIAIIPAFGEEILFRGVVQRKLSLLFNSPVLAIFITSFVFSLIHFQFFGFFPRFFLGLLLGYLFYYSNNLWIPVIAHFINNALAVILMYPSIENQLDPRLNLDNIEVNIIYAIFSCVCCFLLLYLFKKVSLILRER